MLYLLDANVLITAHRLYYPIDQVPEFWAWLKHQGEAGDVKIPIEIWDEIRDGRKSDDSLLDWIKNPETESSLLFDEDVDAALVQQVVSNGYADDLTDVELEQLGRDPFLIAHAFADAANRCVVTTEQSSPSKQRQNKKIPDVCRLMGVGCRGPFELNRTLGFSTAWNR